VQPAYINHTEDRILAAIDARLGLTEPDPVAWAVPMPRVEKPRGPRRIVGVRA
jgi:hypothetical protein